MPPPSIKIRTAIILYILFITLKNNAISFLSPEFNGLKNKYTDAVLNPSSAKFRYPMS